MKIFTSLTTLALAASLGGSALAVPALPDTMPSPNVSMVNLSAQNGSGETGTVTLRQDGPDVIVTITMAGTAVADAQPAHIHTGTCANLDPTPKYPLTNIVKGASTTVLKDMTLKSLETGGFAINVHKSPTDLKTYVACGNILKS
jgi:hypothetical protein